MQITFNLPEVFSPDSDPAENADVLRALLMALVNIDRTYIRRHSTPLIYNSGVRYGRTTLWEPIPAVIARGYGDCKSLAPWLIAQYLEKGTPAKPVFRFMTTPKGQQYHILVQTVGGWEDPSRALGMGRNENAYF